jgi:hypothetical protein
MSTRGKITLTFEIDGQGRILEVKKNKVATG